MKRATTSHWRLSLMVSMACGLMATAWGSAAAQDASVQEGSRDSAGAEWQGSLMFDQKEIDDLLAIYRAYQESVARRQGQEQERPSGDDDVARRTLETLAGIGLEEEKVAVDPEIFTFSLNSILYNSPSDWSIWVNGKRYSRKEALEGFTVGTSAVKVSRVGKDRITYVWTPQPRSLGTVQGRWEDKQKQKDSIGKSHQAAAGEQVNLQDENVTVTLRPNQTFFSEYMTVMEGGLTRRAPSRSGETVREESAESLPMAGVGAAVPDILSPASEEPVYEDGMPDGSVPEYPEYEEYLGGAPGSAPGM